MNKEDIIEVLYTVIKESVDSLVLPTGDTLIPSLKYSTLILAIGVVSDILDLFTFISWQGALLACASLVALAIIERRESDEIRGLYRDAKLRLDSIKSRFEGTSTSRQDVRVIDGVDASGKKDGRRGVSEVYNNDERPNPSDWSGSNDDIGEVYQRQHETDVS